MKKKCKSSKTFIINRQLKFMAACDIGDMLYAVDEDGQGIFQIDKKTGKSKILVILERIRKRAVLYQKAEKYGNKIYFFPYVFTDDKIMAYSMEENAVEYIDLGRKNELFYGDYKPIQRVDDTVWFFPTELTRNLMVWHLDSGVVDVIETWKRKMQTVNLGYSDNYRKVSKMVRVDDEFYQIVKNTNFIASINKKTQEVQLYTLPQGIKLALDIDYDGHNLWIIDMQNSIIEWNSRQGVIRQFQVNNEKKELQFQNIFCGKRYIWLSPFQVDNKMVQIDYQTGDYQMVDIFPKIFKFNPSCLNSIFAQINRNGNMVDLYPFNANLTIHIDLEKDVLLEQYEIIMLPEEWTDEDIVEYELQNQYESKRIQNAYFLNTFLDIVECGKDIQNDNANGKRIWEQMKSGVF